jgi:hypothetical protein
MRQPSRARWTSSRSRLTTGASLSANSDSSRNSALGKKYEVSSAYSGGARVIAMRPRRVSTYEAEPRGSSASQPHDIMRRSATRR